MSCQRCRGMSDEQLANAPYPTRNRTLLVNTPAGRIHAATLSDDQEKIFSSWKEYKKAVRASVIRRNRPVLWKRIYYWLLWKRDWIRNFFTS